MPDPFKLLAAALILGAPCASAPAAAPMQPEVAPLTPDCLSIINLLLPATGDAVIGGSEAARIKTDLLARLDTAARAFADGRAADSAKALIGYRAQIRRLQATGRISPIDAAPLAEATGEAIACVQYGRV